MLRGGFPVPASRCTMFPRFDGSGIIEHGKKDYKEKHQWDVDQTAAMVHKEDGKRIHVCVTTRRGWATRDTDSIGLFLDHGKYQKLT